MKPLTAADQTHVQPGRRQPRPRCRWGLPVAVMVLLAAPPARAETSPWYLSASQGLSHESNLYRIGEQQQLPEGRNKTDTVSTTSLLGGFDKPYSRQRFSGSAVLRANRYQSNKQLDNNGHSLKLGWDWATIERLSGSLTMASDRSLAHFNSLNSVGVVETRRNLIDDNQVDAVARLGVVTRYTVEATLGRHDRRYSAPEYERYEYHQNSGSLGLRYRPSSAISLAVALRQTEGVFPRFSQPVAGVFQEDRFTRQDIDFSGIWNPTGNSNLSARLSPTRTRYDQDTSRDFSGLTGSAAWAWQATGKVKLTTLLSRDTGQSSDAIDRGILGKGVIDYSRTTTALKLQADWAATSKIGVTATAGYARRALVNTPTLSGVAEPQPSQVSGSDHTTSLTLGARWSPIRSVLVGCDITADRRGSDGQLTVSMSANTVGCYGQFTIQ